jgi:hypothetical protein
MEIPARESPEKLDRKPVAHQKPPERAFGPEECSFYDVTVDYLNPCNSASHTFMQADRRRHNRVPVLT